MSGLKLGTSPCSWGVWFGEDDRQVPWERCLDEIHTVGYEWIELGPYGYLPTDRGELEHALRSRELGVAGTFWMGALDGTLAVERIEEEVVATCELLAALDADYLVIIDDVYSDLNTGELLAPRSLDEKGWRNLIENTHHIARIARHRFGLKAAFHPHAETHVEYEDQIEQFLADTDPELVGLCLDTGHHAYRGGDPVALARMHVDRLEAMHFKSVDAAVRERVETESIPFARAVAMGVFCEPEVGVVDFEELALVLNEAGFVGHATVEQDIYPSPPDKPLPIALRTRSYLSGLGF